MIKKIILTALICFIPLQTFAFEDYIILSDFRVRSASSSNENVVSIKPLYSIDNLKRTIVLSAKNEGQAIVTIETENEEFNLNVEVTKNATFIPKLEGFTYYVLDVPSNPKYENQPEQSFESSESLPEKPKLRGE